MFFPAKMVAVSRNHLSLLEVHPSLASKKKIVRRAGGLDMLGHSFDGVTRQTGASENGHLKTAVLIIQ